MATLNVRNLPEPIQAKLRLRAAKSGRSMEAEAREILTAACREPRRAGAEDLQAFVDRLYRGRKPTAVVEELVAERRREAAKG